MKRRILVSAVLSMLLFAALAANVNAAEVKITASDGAAYDRFGASVAISGDCVVVGAYEDADAGNDSGSAYIFKRDGTAWAQEAKITASDGAAYDHFGASVAVSGDCAVLGAWRDGDTGPWSGSSYIFTRDGTTWTEQAKITASDGAAEDVFGSSVAISGDYVVVGADHDDDVGTNSGSAYIYDIPIGIFSCDSNCNPKDQFVMGEAVYVTGNSLPAGTSYKLWIQDEAVSDGDALVTDEDLSGIQESVDTDASGTLPVTAIWTIDQNAAVTHTEYDIVADNQAAGVVGTYNATSDLLDSTSTAGFVAPVPGSYVFTTADVVIALQIAVGSSPPDLRWDVSGDGNVTSLDALMILQAVAGAVEL
ncbi:MAG: hypothetical protein C4B59_00750 [Candidatus Methanogaster sp.]|uniref:Uncharacterized protein n=1 Tax=Candidatus Methanogaster sp. TaxID=3386292 RepID=A0AC61L6X1_9EURY|nr:MAG: hypothetical protein C4B59_00750 [ANME-2 cluster archaeon]